MNRLGGGWFVLLRCAPVSLRWAGGVMRVGLGEKRGMRDGDGAVRSRQDGQKEVLIGKRHDFSRMNEFNDHFVQG